MRKSIIEFSVFVVLTSLVTFSRLDLTTQNQTDRRTEVKKSKSSCNNYTEFKKSQKAIKNKQATKTNNN